MFGIAVVVVPLKAFVAPVKVCTPVFAVKVVALFTKLPAKENAAAAVSFQTAPAFKVTSPVNAFVPVALVKLIVPAIVLVEAVNVEEPILTIAFELIVKVVETDKGAFKVKPTVLLIITLGKIVELPLKLVAIEPPK